MNQPIKAEWVIGRFTSNSPQGKSILAHIAAGCGYHLINQQRGKTDDIIVGFRRATDQPRPSHLQPATEEQAEKLEKLKDNRQKD